MEQIVDFIKHIYIHTNINAILDKKAHAIQVVGKMLINFNLV